MTNCFAVAHASPHDQAIRQILVCSSSFPKTFCEDVRLVLSAARAKHDISHVAMCFGIIHFSMLLRSTIEICRFEIPNTHWSRVLGLVNATLRPYVFDLSLRKLCVPNSIVLPQINHSVIELLTGSAAEKEESNSERKGRQKAEQFELSAVMHLSKYGSRCKFTELESKAVTWSRASLSRIIYHWINMTWRRA